MNLIKYIVSFIWPVTLKKTVSDINGPIEIVLFWGKKMLNSHNANYSFGNLHKVLLYGFNKLEASEIKSFKNILLLGLGGGSAVDILRNKYKSTAHITAIELDAIIIDWAKNDYGLKNDTNMDIINADAYDFVKQCQQKFDFILIDVFIDSEIPTIFKSAEFYNLLADRLMNDGKVILNTIYKGNANTKFKTMLSKVFFKVDSHLYKKLQNEIFILEN